LLSLVLVVGLGVRLVDLNQQGETWDEVAYYDAAHHFFNNLQHRDFNADHWDANHEHPPVAKFIYMAVSIPSFETDTPDQFGAGRVASSAMGLLTVCLVFLIGRRLANNRVGLLAAVTLAFLPIFIAFNLVYGLDTPTTFFFALTAWVFLEAIMRRNHWLYLLAALVAGLAIGTRLSNLLVLPALLSMWVIWRWPFTKKTGFQRVELVHVLTYATVPFLAFFATWPWLWTSNWQNHLSQTFGHWSAVVVPYLGKIVVAPVPYYAVYFLAVTPGLFIVLFGYFVWRALKSMRREWLVVLAWFVVPFAFSFFGTRQGGFRYMLQVMPAMALGVGLALDQLLERMKRRDQVVLIGVFLVYLAIQVLAVRPYYLDYYNEFVGGPKVVAAHRWFQVGWWNEGTEATVNWFNTHVDASAGVAYLAIPDRSERLLWDTGSATDLAHARYVITNPNAEWFTTDPHRLDGFHVIHEETALGAPIASVYERNQ